MSNVLQWILGLDASGFHKELNHASRAVQQGMKGAFRDLLAPVAEVAAAVGSVGAVMKGISGSLGLGAELNEMSQRTGAAVGDLFMLRRAFKDAGVDAESLPQAINKMQRSLTGIGKGGAQGKQAIEGLGLDTGELASMDPAEAFRRIGSAIAGLQNPALAAASAMAIFGRSGGELITVFKNPEFLQSDHWSNTARILSENAAAFREAREALEHVSGKVSGFFTGMGSGFVPALHKAIEEFDKIDLSSFGQQFGYVIGNFVTNFQSAWRAISTAMAETFDILFSGESIKVFGMEFLVIASKFGDALLRAFRTPLDALQAGMQFAMEKAMEALAKIPGLGAALGLQEFKASTFDATLKQVEQEGNGVTNLISGNFENRSDIASGMNLKDRIQAVAAKISANFQPVVTPTPLTLAAIKEGQDEADKKFPAGAKVAPYDPEDMGKAKVIADSMRQIGGGGFAYSPSENPLLKEAREQKDLQKKTNEHLQTIAYWVSKPKVDAPKFSYDIGQMVFGPGYGTATP